MNHIVFSIFDVKAQAYLPPFILPNAEMAARTFGDCINSDNHQFAAHPEDYTLFRLGTFDDNTGAYTLEAAPMSEGNGVEFVQITEARTNDLQDSIKTQVGNGSQIQPDTTSEDSSQ